MYGGLRFTFATDDLSEIQVHYALKIQDRDGHGKQLIQYNRLTLKYDAIAQLKESGRLPIHVRLDYKEEVIKFNKLEAKVNILRKLQKKMDELQGFAEETRQDSKFMQTMLLTMNLRLLFDEQCKIYNLMKKRSQETK